MVPSLSPLETTTQSYRTRIFPDGRVHVAIFRLFRDVDRSCPVSRYANLSACGRFRSKISVRANAVSCGLGSRRSETKFVAENMSPPLV